MPDDPRADLEAEVAHLRAEVAALKAERLLSLRVLERAPVAIEVYDADGVAVWLNQAQIDFLGLPNAEVAIGKFNVLTDPVSIEQGLAATYQAVYDGVVVHQPEMQVDLQAFASRWQSSSRQPWFEQLIIPVMSDDGAVEGVVAFIHEVTERKEAEQAILATQRQESIGLLAGGIAHDFNNLLTAILGNASAARRQSAPPIVEEHLREIEQASERASVLTRQLLAYAGKAQYVRRVLDLTGLVRAIAELMRSIAGPTTIRFELDDDCWVEADEAQLQQVVMNLLTNAVEAIPKELPGTVVIGTTTLDADAAYLSRTFGAPDLAPGRYAVLEVSDSGHGMSPELVARIFDPFFTTKETGHGLGLAGVLGIVRGHGGAIRVYSEPDKGTTVKVLLPCTDVAPEAEVSAERPQGDETATVLVIEDQAQIRRLAGTILTRKGHRVLLAEDGERGLEQFLAHRDEIGVVLLDLTLPKMDGGEVFRQMRLAKPDVVVLLTSGYNAQDTVTRFAGKGLAGFLPKPYSASALTDAIARLLGKPQA
ncbi:MAG: ATP-binding protein [Myxococcota bacterium]